MGNYIRSFRRIIILSTKFKEGVQLTAEILLLYKTPLLAKIGNTYLLKKCYKNHYDYTDASICLQIFVVHAITPGVIFLFFKKFKLL